MEAGKKKDKLNRKLILLFSKAWKEHDKEIKNLPETIML